MKKLILLTSFLISILAFGETPMYKPAGLYVYNKEILLTKKRTAETVGHTTAEGQKRIVLLKKDGFFCVRKNQTNTICQKIETNLEIPAYVKNAVDNHLKQAVFNFSGTGEAVITHDGADTEWMVYEDVFLGNYKIDVYKLVHTKNERWFAVFPVSQEQGIGNIEIKNQETLLYPVTLETQVDGQTVAFFVTATFSK
jgi:hypothetical protein